MRANIGSIDKALRLVLGVALIGLGFLSGGPQILLVVLGGVLVLTAATGFCLIYRLFGMSTCKSN